MQVKDIVRREELRRSLDGILDLERLLSRVTLETANPRDVLALAASLATNSQGAQRSWPDSRHRGWRRSHASIDELGDLRREDRSARSFPSPR